MLGRTQSFYQEIISNVLYLLKVAKVANIDKQRLVEVIAEIREKQPDPAEFAKSLYKKIESAFSWRKPTRKEKHLALYELEYMQSSQVVTVDDGQGLNLHIRYTDNPPFLPNEVILFYSPNQL